MQAQWMRESHELNTLPYYAPIVLAAALPTDPLCEGLDAAWFYGRFGRPTTPLTM